MSDATHIVREADTGVEADGVVPTKKADPRRRRMIIIGGLLLLVVLVAVASQWDVLADRVTSRWAGSSAQPRTQAIATYSGAQGAQDAPRAEVTESRRSDREKCLETLRMRRVALETARDSCDKMVNGIYH